MKLMKYGLFTTITLVIVVLLATMTNAQPAVAQSKQSYDASPIRFSVPGHFIKALKVLGENQYGVMTLWQSPHYKADNFVTIQTGNETDKYWWKGTVALEFDIVGHGWRRCIIDYLKPSPDGSYVPVRYIMGQGCSGASGNTSSDSKFLDGLLDALALEGDGGVSGGAGAAGCFDRLVTGFKSPGVIVDCGNVALDGLHNHLQNDNKSVAIRDTVDFDNYCIIKYGGWTSAVMDDRWDAYSWSCQQFDKSGQYVVVGSLNMDEACKETNPDLPIAVMGNRWDANSWYCTR